MGVSAGFAKAEGLTVLRPLLLNIVAFALRAGKAAKRLTLSRLSGHPREQLPAIVVLALGITLSAAIFFWTHHYMRSGEKQEFDRQAEHYIQTIVNSVKLYEDYLRDLARGFEGLLPMDRWQFDEIAQDLVNRHNGLVALAWIPVVPAERRLEMEASAHEDGLFGFSIRERDAKGNLVDAAPRDAYYPIYYAVPFDKDQEYLGADLYAVEQAASAIDVAAAEGTPVALPGAVELGISSLGNELQILRPVYSNDGTDIGLPREQRLRGFVMGLLRFDRIVQPVLEKLTTPAWLDIYIYRVGEGADRELMLFAPSRLRSVNARPLSRDEIEEAHFNRQSFSLGDMALSIVATPVARKYGFEPGMLPYLAAALGLLVTLFISHNLAAAHSRARLIENTVAERTAALSEANLSLHNEILERQRVELELRSAKDQADVANRAKSEFLAMVSHELRTPLNAIIGFSDIMSQQVFGPVGNRKYSGYIADIRKSGTHLLGLINNILDLSKVESGNFRLSEEPVNLADGVSEVLRLVSELAETNEVNLGSELPDSLPDLRGDRQAIRQILLNLLSNAIKFTEPGGSVQIGARLDEAGRMVLSIQDDGIGIAPDAVAGLFEPFTQVDSSLARRYEGTGLGLPLIRSLVELHGGTVNLESNLGEGTTVTVSFPRERVVGAVTH